MTIQTTATLALKYGVSTRTIRRWHTANIEVEDPLEAACQMLAETSTADTSRIMEILRNQITTTTDDDRTKAD